jgi:lipopolysaccharide assembly outer membrane protein LptD (OstA)
LPLWAGGADAARGVRGLAGITNDAPCVITGERMTYNARSGEARAEGRARVVRGGDEVTADVIRYAASNSMAYAEGDAVARRGLDVLRADALDMNLSNRLAHARGRVVLTRGTNVWTGASVTYDFDTHRASADAFTAWMPPYRILASRGDQPETNRLVLHNVLLTTCTNENHRLHFSLSAKQATLTEGESLRLSGVTWRLGPVPVLYLPGWYRDLNAGMGFHVSPGISSRWGGYLLGSYGARPAPGVKSDTHLDYRTKRGMGYGQDVTWGDPASDWRGGIKGYYARDLAPYDVGDDPVVQDLDENRYRLRFFNDWTPTERDRLLIRFDYLSDTDIYEDFFRRDYRNGLQPENDITFSHTAPFYAANAQWSRRVNTFYTALNREPELSVTFMQREIAATRFYYQGRIAASRLEQVFADVLDADPYGAVRLDSNNTLSRPMNLFGFLTAVPSAGYRLTYYSETPDREVADANGDVSVEEGQDAFRTVPYLGLGLSLRAFRVWPDPVRPYRHVVEPYAQYGWVGEPSVPPEELYPFDEVDGIDKGQSVRLGLRNLLQTKHDNVSVNLADVNVYTDVPLGPIEGGDRFNILAFESDLAPCRSLLIELDGQYSRTEAAVVALDGRLNYDAQGWWRASVAYVLRRDQYRVLLADLAIRPGKSWEVGSLTRYEFEEGHLDEQAVTLAYKVDCLRFGVRAGVLPGYDLGNGARREDEWTVALDIQLTAVPGMGISARSEW